MKYLIHFLFAFALLGCDPTPDVDNSTSDEASDTASVIQPGTGEAQAVVDSAPPELRAQVFQFGIYTARKKGRITDSSQTNTGKVVRKPELEHASMTDRIPLEKDVYFGLQYRLWNLPTEVTVKRVMDLRSVLIHPEMTLPDGSTSTGWDRPVRGIVKSQQVLGFDGYAFNEDYELVEGDWIFQVWYKDRKLVERKFVTVPSRQEKTAEAAKKE